jgi:hypothetical protein
MNEPEGSVIEHIRILFKLVVFQNLTIIRFYIMFNAIWAKAFGFYLMDRRYV